MSTIRYVPLTEVSPPALLTLLNDPQIRNHLIQHPLFSTDSLNAWIDAKVEEDRLPGCRVRAVLSNEQLIGWCGLQRSGEDAEMAIVITPEAWGTGPRIFRDLLGWAGELGHEQVIIHLLDTRRDYRFLQNRATSIRSTSLLDRTFTTYVLPVQ
tara:strand:+ start:46659 stop:47120 length:462 start_codon:yes stop_codon:yes gene_type:complete